MSQSIEFPPLDNASRSETLAGLRGFIRALETRPPHEIFDGYQPDERTGYDPLVVPFYDSAHPGELGRDDSGNLLPADGYDLREVIVGKKTRVGARRHHDDAWEIRLPRMLADQPAKQLERQLGWRVRAQIRCQDVLEKGDHRIYEAPPRTPGTFFLMSRHEMPSGAADALFMPERAISMNALMGFMYSSDMEKNINRFVATGPELLELYTSLRAYWQHFSSMRAAWETLRPRPEGS